MADCLDIMPKRFHFTGAYKYKSTLTLMLRSQLTDGDVFFKLLCTNSNKYKVKPTSGCVAPGKVVFIDVTRKPMASEAQFIIFARSKQKLNVQYHTVTKTGNGEGEEGTLLVMHETKIRCTFELPSHNRIFVSENSLSGESEDAAAEMSNDSGLATDLPLSQISAFGSEDEHDDAVAEPDLPALPFSSLPQLARELQAVASITAGESLLNEGSPDLTVEEVTELLNAASNDQLAEVANHQQHQNRAQVAFTEAPGPPSLATEEQTFVEFSGRSSFFDQDYHDAITAEPAGLPARSEGGEIGATESPEVLPGSSQFANQTSAHFTSAESSSTRAGATDSTGTTLHNSWFALLASLVLLAAIFFGYLIGTKLSRLN